MKHQHIIACPFCSSKDLVKIGNRNAHTFKRLYERLKYKVNIVYTDNWKTYK
jgi:IS1 family transposase